MFHFDDERTRWFVNHVLPNEPALRAWLRRRRSAAFDVDDVIQETYTVLAARDTIDDIRNPRAYLFQVAYSIVVHHVRRARIVSIRAVNDLEGFDPADQAASPEQTTIDRDELQRLAEAIAIMPGRMREAFILRRVHGLTQREVAKRMKFSESTIEKHIGRSVKFLIDRFGDSGRAGPQASRTVKAETAVLDRAKRQRGH
jgi:RNA polymerase sigma-70 factor (ECF subfamily)